jgi:hypothetical protein
MCTDDICDALDQHGALRYEATSTHLEAHSSHSRDLSDDANALDGREVLLVTNPAVVAIGTAEGKDYDSMKVWKKAAVWLG